MKIRLVISVIIVVIAFILVPYFVILSSRPTMPTHLTRLFPASAKLGFVVDIKTLLPWLPKEVSDRISSRLKAFAKSSKVHFATNETMTEQYLILCGAPDLEIAASLIGGDYSLTSIGGMDAVTFEGGCLVEVNENDLFAVLGENALDLASERIFNFNKAPHMLKTIARRFEDVKAGTVFKAFGFPGNETPVLLPGNHFYDLQMATDFFTLMVEKKDGGIYCKLIVYFLSQGARDLELMQTPSILQLYAKDYPAVIPFLKNLSYKGGKKQSIQYELTFSENDFENLTGITDVPLPESSPIPSKTPIIPDLPEFPF